MNYIKQYLLVFIFALGSTSNIFTTNGDEESNIFVTTFTSPSGILLLSNIAFWLGCKAYDKYQEDPAQQKRMDLLLKQQILLNKQDLEKGEQRVEENSLFLKEHAVKIERQHLELGGLALQVQANNCRQCIDAVENLHRLLSDVSPNKRKELQGEIDKRVTEMVKNGCSFGQ